MSAAVAPPRRRRGVALATAVVLLVAGCTNGDALYDYVAQNYQVLAQNGDDNLEARSDQPVDRVAGDLLNRFPGRDVYSDPTAGTFYRYDDDFVAVRPDPRGGSLISLDDDETGSTRWVPIIGGFYLPGGRFGGPRVRTGGTGETNRGGGPGTGK
ncbi:MAG: DUF4247 domain-containing protein [Actinomycetota bacterium]|nr:DUF4247 domain-containing protein [Actinomycetota bacterium]